MAKKRKAAKKSTRKKAAKKSTRKKAAKKLRIAIIGCGGISETHIKAMGQIPEFEIVAMSDNLFSFEDAVDQLDPRVAVLDWGMRPPKEPHFLRRFLQRHPGVGTVVICDLDDDETVESVLEAGALACVSKRHAARDLVPAVWAASRGHGPHECGHDDIDRKPN